MSTAPATTSELTIDYQGDLSILDDFRQKLKPAKAPDMLERTLDLTQLVLVQVMGAFHSSVTSSISSEQSLGFVQITEENALNIWDLQELRKQEHYGKLPEMWWKHREIYFPGIRLQDEEGRQHIPYVLPSYKEDSKSYTWGASPIASGQGSYVFAMTRPSRKATS